MINWLIRIISFVICLVLLAGGIVLTITSSMNNDDLKADFQEISNTPWIPEAVEENEEEQLPKDEEKTPDSGDENPEGGAAVTE